jgi:hypothetical protein
MTRHTLLMLATIIPSLAAAEADRSTTRVAVPGSTAAWVLSELRPGARMAYQAQLAMREPSASVSSTTPDWRDTSKKPVQWRRPERPAGSVAVSAAQAQTATSDHGSATPDWRDTSKKPSQWRAPEHATPPAEASTGCPCPCKHG